MATAYLVGKAEYAAMVASIANHDTGGVCVSCVHPAVQALCQNGICVGELQSFYAEGTPFDQSHCGPLSLPDASTRYLVSPAPASDGGATAPSVWHCGS